LEVLVRAAEHVSPSVGSGTRVSFPAAPPGLAASELLQSLRAPHGNSEPTPPSIPIRESPALDRELVDAFQRAIEELGTARALVFQETEDQAARLALRIAERVIAREVEIRPSIVLGLVREGLAVLGERDRVLVRVGSGFEAAAQALEAEARSQAGGFEVLVDPSLGRHGCIVETHLGRVDESIESRIASLVAALLEDSSRPARARGEPGDDA
jgi:flagellar assembly protein FliH